MEGGVVCVLCLRVFGFGGLWCVWVAPSGGLPLLSWPLHMCMYIVGVLFF